MKSRFTSIDIIAILAEVNEGLIGMRVNQIYDVDHKTYLIKLHRSEEKAILLFESGIRIHTTEFEWPKNPAPSGFSMKLRKHLNNKRLEKATQLGQDRIVDLQFGTGEAAYHVIIELYDRGNIVLTDYEYLILNILRPRTEGEDVRFVVKEKYPVENGTESSNIDTDMVQSWLLAAKDGDNLKKILVPKTSFGPALTEHVLLEFGFPTNAKIGTHFIIDRDLPKLHLALKEGEGLIKSIGKVPKGVIIQKRETRPDPFGNNHDFLTNLEFHPMIYKQHENQPHIDFATFNQAVDDFFSKMESQKLDLKAIQQEKEALKKLSNIKQDHEKRLASLQKIQENDERKARLIEMNQPLIDHAIQVVRSALANQVSWKDIEEMVEEAKRREDPVAIVIKKLKLEINHITLLLSDPYAEYDSSDDSGAEEMKPQLVDIDLDLSAFGNARKYFGEKKNASKKEQKTIESSHKAFKSAEKKAKQSLLESAAIATIRKARKTLWFEKFYWFISSDNYLVVGGRDRQQNELLVKRYMKLGDVYVHADLHGASSVIIKNSTSGNPIPPRTLQEAGLIAVGYSAAWEAKVMTTAWWVESSQVSKTAPSGEYLTTGSFMIRGKKNFLPPIPIVLGFGLLFRLEESSISRHLNDRKPKAIDEDVPPSVDSETIDDDVSCSSDSSSDIEEKKNYEKSIEDARTLLGLSKIDCTSEVAFPDTVVDINVATLTGNSQLFKTNEDESYTIIRDLPVVNKPIHPAREDRLRKIPQPPKNSAESRESESQFEKIQQSTKRGQKGKLKKIKEKYKDQDEDERQLKMELLQSAGPAKNKGKNKKKGDHKNRNSLPEKPTPKSSFMVKEQVIPSQTTHEPTDVVTDKAVLQLEADEEVKNDNVNEEPTDDLDGQSSSADEILNALTGIPLSEDELLYAIPVVAPYSTLMPYKFKVKIMPGQTKRGKASKTAMAIFLADKTATSREKDLIKSLKDQDLGRNFPGRVKLAVPQSLKPKK